eukprot:gene15649-biopygen14275
MVFSRRRRTILTFPEACCAQHHVSPCACGVHSQCCLWSNSTLTACAAPVGTFPAKTMIGVVNVQNVLSTVLHVCCVDYSGAAILIPGFCCCDTLTTTKSQQRKCPNKSTAAESSPCNDAP